MPEPPIVSVLPQNVLNDLEAEAAKVEGLPFEFRHMIRKGELTNALRNLSARAYAKGTKETPAERMALSKKITEALANAEVTADPEKDKRQPLWKLWASLSPPPRYGDPTYEKSARSSRAANIRALEKENAPQHIIDMLEVGDDVGALLELYRFNERARLEIPDRSDKEAYAAYKRRMKRIWTAKAGTRYRVDHPTAIVKMRPRAGEGNVHQNAKIHAERNKARRAGTPLPPLPPREEKPPSKNSLYKLRVPNDVLALHLQRAGLGHLTQALMNEDYETVHEGINKALDELKEESNALPDPRVDWENAPENEAYRVEIRKEMRRLYAVRDALKWRIENPHDIRPNTGKPRPLRASIDPALFYDLHGPWSVRSESDTVRP